MVLDFNFKFPTEKTDEAVASLLNKAFGSGATDFVRIICEAAANYMHGKTSRSRKMQWVRESKETIFKAKLEARTNKALREIESYETATFLDDSSDKTLVISTYTKSGGEISKFAVSPGDMQELVELIQRLGKIDQANIQKPPMGILLPLAESAALLDDDPNLREKYHNLLASSMDKSREMYAHPAFPSFLDQLSADDVKVFEKLVETRQFPIIRLVSHYGVGYVVLLDNISLLALRAGCDHPEAVPAYLQNLDRLGLITITYDENLIKPDSSPPPAYREIFSSEVFASDIKRLQEEHGEKLKYKHGLARVTPLGDMFFKACNSEHSSISNFSYDVSFSTGSADSPFWRDNIKIDCGDLDDNKKD